MNSPPDDVRIASTSIFFPAIGSYKRNHGRPTRGKRELSCKCKTQDYAYQEGKIFYLALLGRLLISGEQNHDTICVAHSRRLCLVVMSKPVVHVIDLAMN